MTLTAAPGPAEKCYVFHCEESGGSYFGGWSGDCAHAGTNPTCTLTINGDTYVSARFTLNP